MWRTEQNARAVDAINIDGLALFQKKWRITDSDVPHGSQLR